MSFRRVFVPDVLRPWSVIWPAYQPADITPPALTPAGLPVSVAEGWAEPYGTPHDVPDWPTRQAAALIPFTFDHLAPTTPATEHS